MSEIWSIISVLFNVILTIGVIILVYTLYQRNKGEENLEDNLPFVLNFMKDRAGGHGLGLCLNPESPKDNSSSSIIRFYPIDHRYKDGKKISKTSIVDIPCQNTKIKVLPPPVGNSNYRTMMFLEPVNSTDMAEEYADTWLGKALMRDTEEMNVINSAIRNVKLANRTREAILQELDSNHFIDEMKRRYESYIKERIVDAIPKENTLEENKGGFKR